MPQQSQLPGADDEIVQYPPGQKPPPKPKAAAPKEDQEPKAKPKAATPAPTPAQPLTAPVPTPTPDTTKQATDQQKPEQKPGEGDDIVYKPAGGLGGFDLSYDQNAAQKRTQEYLKANEAPDFLSGAAGAYTEAGKGMLQFGEQGAIALRALFKKYDPGPFLNLSWETAKGIAQPQIDDLKKAREHYRLYREALKRGDKKWATGEASQYAGYMATGLTPILGPAISQIAENIGQGNYGAAFANATMVFGPEMLRFAKIGPIARQIPRSAKETQAIEETEQAGGVRTSVGQRSGSLRLQRNERQLVNFAGSEQRAREFYEGQQQDLEKRARFLATTISPFGMTGEDAGITIKQSLLQRTNKLHGAGRQLYDSVETKAGLAKRQVQNGYVWDAAKNQYVENWQVMDAPVDIRQMKQNLRPLYDEFDYAFSDPYRRASSPGFRALDMLMKTPDWYMNAVDFDKTLSAIKGLVRPDKTGTITSKILSDPSKRVAQIFISDGEQRLTDAYRAVNPNILTELKTARRLWREYINTAEFAGELGEEPGKVYDALVKRQGRGALDNLRTLRLWQPQETDMLARTWMEEEIRKATSQGGFQRTAGLFADFDNMPIEVRELLFGKAKTEELGNFFLAAKKLNPHEGSETAGRIAAALPYVAAAGAVAPAVKALIEGLITGNVMEAVVGGLAAPIAAYAGYRFGEYTFPRILARTLFQPGGAKLWEQAIRLPGTSPAWRRTMQILNARMIGAERQIQQENQDKQVGAKETPAAAQARVAKASTGRGATMGVPRPPGAQQPAAQPAAPRAAPPPAAAAPAPQAAAVVPPAEQPRTNIRAALSPTLLGMVNTAAQGKVPPAIPQAIARWESSGNAFAEGPVITHGVDKGKKAQGLMQLSPSTQERYGVMNPFDPEESVRGGVALLRDLMNHYNGEIPSVLAAYYGGQEAVDEYQEKNPGVVPPWARTYVQGVLSLMPGYGRKVDYLNSEGGPRLFGPKQPGTAAVTAP